MITIGVDAHKRVHEALALDEAGREVGSWRGPNSRESWARFAIWLNSLGESRRIGIEGAWGYGRGLAQHLVSAGEVVYEVNPRWTALGRRSARRPGKTDRLDAMAVARFVQREGDSLDQVCAEDETAILDMLSQERDGALAEATRLRNQIHALLLQLDPEYEQSAPVLKTQAGLRYLLEYQATTESPLDQVRVEAVHRLAERLRLALQHTAELAKKIRDVASKGLKPLTELCGISLLTAGALAGILGPGRRFRSDAALAAYAGAAPLEASSAERVRHRLNRGGNRRLNAILYRIVLTQARCSPEAKSYITRRVNEGKTKREAHRALKRFVIRAIWRLWEKCSPRPISHSVPSQEAVS